MGWPKKKKVVPIATHRQEIHHLEKQYLQVSVEKLEALVFLLGNRHSKKDNWEQCEDIYNEIGQTLGMQRELLEREVNNAARRSGR